MRFIKEINFTVKNKPRNNCEQEKDWMEKLQTSLNSGKPRRKSKADMTEHTGKKGFF